MFIASLLNFQNVLFMFEHSEHSERKPLRKKSYARHYIGSVHAFDLKVTPA